ncbi:MAG: hypothetical protein V7647_2640 [Acidobacteriota bacterium]|jgi:aspartyl/asparaginyl beta-hydroxylase (cupin superfamily)
MSRTLLLVVAFVVCTSALYPAAQACGDKFLMVGRGAKFQRAYASLYPGKVLIYARPSRDPNAGVNNAQLHKALRQAGHTVSIIDDWTLLEQALKTVPFDVILVDVDESPKLQALVSSSPAHPEALYVASPSSAPASSRQQIVCRLKSSDRPLKYLDEIENALKARAKHTRTS